MFNAIYNRVAESGFPKEDRKCLNLFIHAMDMGRSHPKEREEEAFKILNRLYAGLLDSEAILDLFNNIKRIGVNKGHHLERNPVHMSERVLPKKYMKGAFKEPKKRGRRISRLEIRKQKEQEKRAKQQQIREDWLATVEGRKEQKENIKTVRDIVRVLPAQVDWDSYGGDGYRCNVIDQVVEHDDYALRIVDDALSKTRASYGASAGHRTMERKRFINIKRVALSL